MCNGQCLTGCPYPDNPEKCKGGSDRSALPWRDIVLPNQRPTAAKTRCEAGRGRKVKER